MVNLASMKTDTSCHPFRGRIGDDLSNALVELGRCGGHGPSRQKSKKESGEVNHDVEVSTKDNGEHSSWSCGKKERKLRVRQVPVPERKGSC
jgi:hypothetical protein